MKYIIGVDGGGTSTETIAYTLEGTEMYRTKTGFGNLLNGVEKGLAHIQIGIERMFEKFGQNNCQLVVLGLAGVDSGDFRAIIKENLKSYAVKTVILNDAWLAHYALLKGEAGCLVISGTGSIMIGRYKSEEARVGGWGHILGDRGSGYGIAKAATQELLQSIDEGRSFTALEEKILEAKNFSTPFELVRFIYSASKDEVAELTLTIAAAAEAGDKQAHHLLDEAGRSLAHETILLIQKLEIPQAPKVAVTGSVLLNNEQVYKMFKKAVRKSYEDAEFVREQVSNTVGAYYYYLQELN